MREPVLGAIALPCAVCTLLGACGRTERAPPVADAATSTPPASASSSSTPRPHWGEVAAAMAHQPCRIVGLEGDVRAEDAAQPAPAHGKSGSDAAAGLALVTQQEIPVESWLLLGPASHLVAKDPRTTRETTFLGAGRVRPCVGRREESWVASGAFESILGAGETPGAEEWVVTPLAVVRYTSAKVRIEVGSKATRTALVSGTAFAWRTDDASARLGDGGLIDDAGTESDGWQRVTAGTLTFEASAAPSATARARAAVEQCTTLADRSRDLGAMLMAPSVGLPEASAITEQVNGRRLARAACAVASLRVATLPPAASRDALEASLGDAVTAWTAVPLPGKGGKEGEGGGGKGAESGGGTGASPVTH